MAYRIEYGPATPPQYIKRPKLLKLQIMTAVCLLLFTLLVRQAFPAGADKLRQILLPGTPGVTQQALDTLMGNLRDGAPVGDSLTAFCQYMIDHDEALSD